MIGPIWGALLFLSLGYSAVFVAQAVVIFVNALVLGVLREKERTHPHIKIENNKRISYSELLCNS